MVHLHFFLLVGDRSEIGGDLTEFVRNVAAQLLDVLSLWRTTNPVTPRSSRILLDSTEFRANSNTTVGSLTVACPLGT